MGIKGEEEGDDGWRRESLEIKDLALLETDRRIDGQIDNQSVRVGGRVGEWSVTNVCAKAKAMAKARQEIYGNDYYLGGFFFSYNGLEMMTK